jgi:hypothetical protein
MIPTMGLMIGFYILTRMIELLALKDRGVGTKIMAGITLLVTLFSIVDLVMSGSKTTFPMP